MKINEDFTKLYNRWKGGENRKEDDVIKKFINSRPNPEDYYITDENILNCKGDVSINQETIVNHKLPFKFGKVAGKFAICKCDIDSLEGCPDTVGEDLELWNLSSLKSLKGCPQKIGVSFFLTNVAIETFEGCTQDIGGSISLFGCNKLTSLKGMPKEINSDIRIKYCESFESLDELPELIKGTLEIYGCKKEFTKHDVPNNCRANDYNFV